jgi:hypothetical protein
LDEVSCKVAILDKVEAQIDAPRKSAAKAKKASLTTKTWFLSALGSQTTTSGPPPRPAATNRVSSVAPGGWLRNTWTPPAKLTGRGKNAAVSTA